MIILYRLFDMIFLLIIKPFLKLPFLIEYHGSATCVHTKFILALDIHRF